MSAIVDLWDVPDGIEHLIVGWHQWADAGNVSSGLPQYLIELTSARRIGELRSESFYLFQIPGAHELLRPVVRLKDGYSEAMERRQNEFFVSTGYRRKVALFLGEEPHLNQKRYADAFFDAATMLGVKKIIALGGVHAPVPHDRERDIGCVYSLPKMKEELSHYAVRFSDYEGGATIGAYLADAAEARDLEFFILYAMVPSYQFSESSVLPHQIAMAEDPKAWYDIMRRLDHMLRLELNLSDLAERSEKSMSEWTLKMEHLAEAMPDLKVGEYLEKISEDFTENRYMPYSDIWEEALGDMLEDL